MTHKSNHPHQSPVAARGTAPIYLVDSAGKVRYVLLPAEQYQRVRPLLESEGFSIAQTYPLQEQVAHAAGWDDPLMDEYDAYDAHRPNP